MAKVQVKTYTRLGGADEAVEVVMQIDLLPRGSGNRNMARRLADEFRRHKLLGPHITQVNAGASRVTVHLRPTLDAMQAVVEWQRQSRQETADRDQMMLPGVAVA